MSPQSDAAYLLQFNRRLLEQALALVAAFDAPGAPTYSNYVGAHLRHVIEHYEALVFAPLTSQGNAGAPQVPWTPAAGGRREAAAWGHPVIVDYDARSRDRDLEQHTALARARLLRIAKRLTDWPAVALAAPISVRTRGGLLGEIQFSNRSTLGRELVFLASHAVHHFALLQVYCLQHSISMGANFGKAPATVAHESRA